MSDDENPEEGGSPAPFLGYALLAIALALVAAEIGVFFLFRYGL